MMGMWFLASAYGQYVAGLLGAGMSTADPNATNLKKLQAYTDGYLQLGIYALISPVWSSAGHLAFRAQADEGHPLS